VVKSRKTKKLCNGLFKNLNHGGHGKKTFVIPAKAGIHRAAFAMVGRWTPACAGVTV
jgi:hypothetical protein